MPPGVVPDLQEKMPKTASRTASARNRRVAILVYDGLCTFEYGIVAEVFGLHRPEVGGFLYDVSSVAIEERPLRASGGIFITAAGSLGDVECADTIVVPGWRGKDEPVPKRLCDVVLAAHRRGARIVSICSGIYVLAAAGLLSDRRATTHWRYVKDFSSKYPDVDVRPNELYVDDGDIVTSAGSSAGIDTCINIVRSDYGAKTANSVARRMVMHSHRQGGQAQFIEQPIPKLSEHHRLSELVDEIRAKLSENYRIPSLAKSASMSTRTFQRKFLAFTGIPVMQWIVQERLSHACLLLETTELSLDTISQSAGFKTAEAMRYHFRRILRLSPLDYRRRFRRERSVAS